MILKIVTTDSPLRIRRKTCTSVMISIKTIVPELKTMIATMMRISEKSTPTIAQKISVHVRYDSTLFFVYT